MADGGKTRVLIVDDSAIVRKLLAEAVSQATDLEVVGTAPDPYIARDKILALQPDVLTLDIEMPRMDGLTFLKRLMQYRPMPVIVISSLGQSGCRAALEALQSGAIEVLAKPGGPYSVGELRVDLPVKIRAASQARLRGNGVKASEQRGPGAGAARLAPELPADSLIAIGASTGGTEAVQAILERLPLDCPPIVVAQHIPAGFSRAFAERLNRICAMEVREASDGDRVTPGRALIAPGNYHLVVERDAAGYRACVRSGPAVCYQRPSVDVLFRSVAQAAGAKGVGAILTGMGTDGAAGLLEMRKAGAHTIAQDESTCIVFGMPREAIRLGAADRVLPLSRIAAGIAHPAPSSIAR